MKISLFRLIFTNHETLALIFGENVPSKADVEMLIVAG
jgi:hypothetical protein